ncbi:hypothetical protein [Streptomyces sp. NEAU-YJ-81]|uniref:hypothetical protein n=1 Tax=Streptomyces sp. NEAU-YJ-81 TaxID=2820288 RepID=UPI001ABD358E|nr:hypothetical protein [Streptomyces sp. NEAU-YJ-81]MBO3681924.1 hypothetical protein [Streptomyces sp. NEAU-YJ-81]
MSGNGRVRRLGSLRGSRAEFIEVLGLARADVLSAHTEPFPSTRHRSPHERLPAG